MKSKRNWILILALVLAWGAARQVKIALLIRQLGAEETLAPKAGSKAKPLPGDHFLILKERAALRLGEMRARKAVPALIELLKHPDVEVQAHAAYALGQIGSEEAVPALAERLKNQDPVTYLTRRVAAAALWQITGRYDGMKPEAWADSQAAEGGAS
jgi:HEAT repeat protein